VLGRVAVLLVVHGLLAGLEQLLGRVLGSLDQVIVDDAAAGQGRKADQKHENA